jgi:hypothetical protein
MFAYPPQSEVNRTIPKNMIYKNAKPSKAVKNNFIAQIKDIIWKYKLSEDTINISPKDGFEEIQIFEINLKTMEYSSDVLKSIDKCIPYPIFYQLKYSDQINHVTTYKRPGISDMDKWVITDYFETGWNNLSVSERPLPVALDLKSLYEQMLIRYIGLSPRSDESINDLIERIQLIRKSQRELLLLEANMAKEIQFNRKVELNSQIRKLRAKLKELQ